MAKRLGALPLPRYILPESVDEGAVIRATWTVGDVEHTRMGRVGKIERHGSSRSFVSPDGNIIVTLGSETKTRITLLAEAPIQPQPTLFQMED